MSAYVKFFEELNHHHVSVVGGKNASLGEMYRELGVQGIKVPNGFATTADAFRYFIEQNALRDPIQQELGQLDKENYTNLNDVGAGIRRLILDAHMPEEIANAISYAYQRLEEEETGMESVAVRSSATAEDLPQASFAGQHESFLNIQGKDEVVNAVQRCYASLFTNRAIKYREDNGFDHMEIALSAGVQRMVRADKASSGVGFTIAPESGFDQVVFLTGAWGLGENVVQGTVISDEFYVYKPNLISGRKAILSKSLGSKEKTMIYTESKSRHGKKTLNIETPESKRNEYVLNDDEIKTLAGWLVNIERHYAKPMDVEWAKDGNSGELFIVQARPETVHSQKDFKKLKQYKLKERGKEITRGHGIGNKIASGKVKILSSPKESAKLKKGDVLVTTITNPDWDPVMKKASAIITNSGGRTSHAAIVARELGVVAVVGTENATKVLEDGQEVTVSCAEGDDGIIYQGLLEWEEKAIDLEKTGNPDTEVMLILADPGMAFQYARYPTDGVGLLRLEFVINNAIRIHPLALTHFEHVKDPEAREKIQELTKNYPDKASYFTEKLSQTVGTIAAAFYDRDVIVRMSDFKSNEYANLIGGRQFEPREENPMLGYRGASRYYSDHYRQGFKLECEAMRIVREDMGFDNVKLMIPFCRTVDEGREVIRIMESYGLKQGVNGLEIYVMVEIPANVLLADQFAQVFDGFSIGSNDLTQLTLGVDRDSALVSDIFNENNDAVIKMISMVIQSANQTGTKIGLCGQAPSDFPEFAGFLVKQGINSIAFSPDALPRGIENILRAEGRLKTLNTST